MMMTDKKKLFDLYKQLLVYIVCLGGNEKHHIVHALSLSLVETMTPEFASETRIMKYNYLSGQLQLILRFTV